MVLVNGEQENLPAFSGEDSLKEQQVRSRQERLYKALWAGTFVWCAGMLQMVSYFGYSWIKIRDCVRDSKQVKYSLEGNESSDKAKIFFCRRIDTPFLFGILRPEIYIPFDMAEEDLPHIIRHELAHRKRRDYLVKPIAFLLLAVHWFNPCIWIAYKMLCKDMELACDEMVIRDMAARERKAYSRALLNCSVWKERAASVPVAFGELSVKERIKNILNYKKPSVLAIGLGVVLCAALLFCFMTQRSMGDGKKILLTNEAGKAGELADEPAGESVDLETGGNAGLETEESDDRSLAFVKEWADALCDRDGKILVSLCSEELLHALEEEETILFVEGEEMGFGWSSPWPWDREADYRIMSVTDTTAQVLYYAWTSDPHVTVWEENLTWHREGEKWVMDSSDLIFRDNLCTGEEFYSAYPEGIINDTRMDYRSNGAGEALGENAKANRDIYEPLFSPDTAACFLLNLLNNEGKVEITVEEEEEGKAQVSIEFILDHTQVHVTMVKPYGEDGIWIPQTWEE